LRRQESVGSWLHGVAYRVALNARAAAVRRSFHEGRVTPGKAADPFAEITLREAQAVLDAELSRMPEKFRAHLVLCCLEGLTRDEAARQLGWSPSTLKSRLEGGRQLLGLRLTRRGLTLSAALGAVLLSPNLAQAHVPAELFRSTLLVALACAGKAGSGSGVPSAAALMLAKAVLRGMAWAQLKIIATLFLVTGALSAGAALLALRGDTPQASANPPASAVPRQGVAGEPQVLVDSHGDPLPDGALLRLGTIRFRHAGGITEVGLSADGEVLATTGFETAQLWNTKTGKPGFAIPCKRGLFNVAQHLLAFSPDAKKVFVADEHGVLGVNLTSGQTEVVVSAGNATVGAVHSSPDGQCLAVGTGEGVLLVELASSRVRWQTRNGAPARSAKDKDDRLLFGGPYSLAMFAPDGKLVAVNSGDEPKALRLLDSATGAERRRIELEDRLVRLAFSPDGRRVGVTERDHSVRVYDTATGRRLHSWTVKLTNPYENYTCPIAFSPDGATLAVGATDHLVHLWDLRTGRELAPLHGHVWYVSGLVFAPDGRYLYSAGWDGRICRWDTATWQQKRVAENPATGMVACSPRDALLAWEGDGGVLHLSDTVTGSIRRTLPGNPAGYSHLAFSPDGSVLAAGGNDLSVQLWDVKTGSLLRRWAWPKGKDPHAAVDDMAFTPDGNTLATAGFRSHEVLLWDVRSGTKLARAPHKMVFGVAFSVDGQTLVTAGWDRAVRWWKMPDLQPIDAVIMPEANQGNDVGKPGDWRFHALARSPDGRLLATISLDGFFSVWDATSHALLHSFRGLSGQCGTAFSPDGQWLTVGGYEGGLAIWEARTGAMVLKLAGHPARIYSIAFSPDGRTLITGSDDNTVLVWQLRPKTEAKEAPSVATLWDALAGSDAPAAYRAVWQLADRPEQSVPFLKGKLIPVKPIAQERLKGLFGLLDSDKFAERETASSELAAFGDAIVAQLRDELGQSTTAEKRRRLQQLLARLSPSLEEARYARAVVVLKWTNTPEARRLLQDLARGVPEAQLTREAKMALEYQNRHQSGH
jgi:WD40 repeat protein